MSVGPIPLRTINFVKPYNTETTPANNQQVLLWSQTVSPRMLAVGGAIFSKNGTPPPTPPSDAYLMIPGVAQVSFTLDPMTGNYYGTLTFPVAFPNGLLTFQATGLIAPEGETAVPVVDTIGQFGPTDNTQVTFIAAVALIMGNTLPVTYLAVGF